MLYKTIVLELLKQRPKMHEQLRKERMLLKTMEQHAIQLKTNHQAWKDRLLALSPASDPKLIGSEALEMALMELEEHLPAESPASDDQASLD